MVLGGNSYVTFPLASVGSRKKTPTELSQNYEIMTSVEGYTKIQLMKSFTK